MLNVWSYSISISHLWSTPHSKLSWFLNFHISNSSKSPISQLGCFGVSQHLSPLVSLPQNRSTTRQPSRSTAQPSAAWTACWSWSRPRWSRECGEISWTRAIWRFHEVSINGGYCRYPINRWFIRENLIKMIKHGWFGGTLFQETFISGILYIFRLNSCNKQLTGMHPQS